MPNTNISMVPGYGEVVNFGKIPSVIDLPNLIEIQKKSYAEFLQTEIPPDERLIKGLHEAFLDVFPIVGRNNSSMEYVSYTLGKPHYSIEECMGRGMTYAAPLKVRLRLVIRKGDEKTGEMLEPEIKEQQIYFGEIPLMTAKGTFVINGAERVVVSQLHRSPGVFFTEDKHQSTGKPTYGAKLIPYRGAWVEMEIDHNNLMYVTVDRKRKLLITTFLRALGFQTDEEILGLFYPIREVSVTEKASYGRRVGFRRFDNFVGSLLQKDLVDHKGEVLAKKGTKLTKKFVRAAMDLKIKFIYIKSEDKVHPLIGKSLAADVVDVDTGEVIAESQEVITPKLLTKLQELNIKKVSVADIDIEEEGIIINTLEKDTVKTREEALNEIYRRLRPGNIPSLKSAEALIESLFFSPRRYDLGKVGRYKLNRKLKLDPDVEERILRNEDIVGIIMYLIDLKDGIGVEDDIDHLGNRRVRSVGELLQNQFRIGLARMERVVREKMSILDLDNMMPHNIINSKSISATVNDFFGRSQLSQFMDQINPLAELTQKRRLSALGPGGLNRERAGFEVRDVHHTHYGRLCPVETPEGPNIGLISSLSTYARINEFGFIETPYRVVDKSIATKEIRYLSADEEDEYYIAQANAPLDEKGKFIREKAFVRFLEDYLELEVGKVEFMDVSPKQLVSVSASLIPFLEHDDANRALMGSNMQRQGVPLMVSEAPLVMTGVEHKAARDSGAVVVAQNGGTVVSANAGSITIKADTKGRRKTLDFYKLLKFKRSNQSTCINQAPIVKVGDKIEAGQIIADGPATDEGRLALGKNVLVAFMSWGGYNYEDAILVSERLVKDDVFTSIYIEEFEIEARDTKLGKEEITRDIPNVSEEYLRNLDIEGIIMVGAEVKPGDVLVGKVTPKGEKELTAEEKLLRAIFGEKAREVRDASLKVPPGQEGTVIDVKVFSRRERGTKPTADEEKEIARLKKCKTEELDMVKEEMDAQYAAELQRLKSDLVDFNGRVIYKSSRKVTKIVIEDVRQWLRESYGTLMGDAETLRIRRIFEEEDSRLQDIDEDYNRKINQVSSGDELPPGVIKLVKVYVAKKRKLQVGDKMAGRHGNKGVVAKVLPEEDMPYTADGTRADIVLNPLSVPSRMNVGQVLETHLGWAMKALGQHAITPVFEGAEEDELKQKLIEAGLPEDGKTVLYDGRTGEPFDQRVMVGQIYILKLAHLVDDKIHARSIGPYSLVTQQPLGGKAQFGGQRFGEMEVWALEAYGAAYTLQELLTVKSDDVVGRTKIYEAIVKGENVLTPGIPESFNVLVKELQGLCLSVHLLERTDIEDSSGKAESDTEDEKKVTEQAAAK